MSDKFNNMKSAYVTYKGKTEETGTEPTKEPPFFNEFADLESIIFKQKHK